MLKIITYLDLCSLRLMTEDGQVGLDSRIWC